MLPPFSVVIPCFNEAARIGQTLRLTLEYLVTHAPESELIVVNDGSTDTTGTETREGFDETKIETRLLENFPNRGKGAGCAKDYSPRKSRSVSFSTRIFLLRSMKSRRW